MKTADYIGLGNPGLQYGPKSSYTFTLHDADPSKAQKGRFLLAQHDHSLGLRKAQLSPIVAQSLQSMLHQKIHGQRKFRWAKMG